MSDADRHGASRVVLVDVLDRAVGEEEKLSAHRRGLLHRAYSHFVISDGRMLLQRRAAKKYHFGGVWTNACCSHPAMGDEMRDSLVRRTEEEMGLRSDAYARGPEELFSFVYRASWGDLIEYEYDHVFLSQVDSGASLHPNRDEVDDVAWVPMERICDLLLELPGVFSPWFVTAFPRVLQELEEGIWASAPHQEPSATVKGER